MSKPSRDASSAGGAEPPARRRSKYGSTSDSPFVEVAAVDREREQVAERIRVDVARHLDEVRDVAPPDPVVVRHLDRVAEHPALLGAPELGDALDGQLALLAPAGVDRMLEAVHRDLAEDGRDRVVDPADEQVEQRPRIVLALLQLLEGERLGEDRRRLGERQRRPRVQQAEILGERAVQAVPELVREREHAAPLAGVVHQARTGARPGPSSRRRRRASSPAAAPRRSSPSRRSRR